MLHREADTPDLPMHMHNLEYLSAAKAANVPVEQMRIAVLGLGYVGLTAAVCLAHAGHIVHGIDVNHDKVEQVNRAIPPIVEPGLQDLLEKSVETGRLLAIPSLNAEMFNYDVIFICVGTPMGPDGSHNMTAVIEVTRQVAAILARQPSMSPTVVYRSTVPPGTMDDLIVPLFRGLLGEQALRKIELLYHPEFMRESTAINDYFDPPKIIIGSRTGEPTKIDDLYATFSAPFFHTSYREAELLKLVDNSWHALKVAYANEIGRICFYLGISAKKIHEMFIADTKLNISPRYLMPGGAFGGSCLPKDLRALQYLASDIGANTSIIDAVARSNDVHKHFLFQYCSQKHSPPAHVLLLGLAFKSQTDDLRESPGVDLARKLLNAGFRLSVYDPTVDEAKLIGQNLGYAAVHLPKLSSILISECQLKHKHFDLVIDAIGIADQLDLSASRIVNIDALP